jgi:hypothetical protein
MKASMVRTIKSTVFFEDKNKSSEILSKHSWCDNKGDSGMSNVNANFKCLQCPPGLCAGRRLIPPTTSQNKRLESYKCRSN